MDLRDYQLAALKASGERHVEGVQRQLIVMATGLGKAQPTYSGVLTPTGFKPMGQVLPGDEVIAGDGTPTIVVGVYPQGEKEIYSIEFSDGSNTHCCKEHLWVVQTKSQKCRGAGFTVLPLEKLINDLKDGSGANKWFIPLVEPVQFKASDVPLDPYLLGVLLGDGGLTHTVIFSSPDEFIIEEVKKRIPKECSVKRLSEYDYQILGTGKGPNTNKITNILRELDVFGKSSYDKFIPANYLYNSIEVRLQVLRGLLDTDGHIRPIDRHIEFSTASKQLAEDVCSIVQSLGGSTKVRNKKAGSYTYKGEKKTGAKSYRVTINIELCPFLLPRKAKLFIANKKQGRTKAFCSVTLHSTHEAQCIEVAHPSHTYVTDHYTVTHNTVVFSQLPQINPGKTLVLAHREELLKQAGHKIQAANPNIYIGIEQAEKHAHPDCDVILASVATIGRMHSHRLTGIKNVKNLIIDEAHHCHKAGTLISTPLGLKKIEEIKTGDKVYSYSGNFTVIRNVVRTFQYNYEGLLLHIITENGSAVTVTPNHKLYSNGKKQYASSLSQGQTLTSLPEVRQNVRGYGQSSAQIPPGMEIYSRRKKSSSSKGNAETVFESSLPKILIESNDKKESNGYGYCKAKNDGYSENKNSQNGSIFFSKIREWPRYDSDRNNSGRTLYKCSKEFFNSSEGWRTSVSLQSGLRLGGPENNIRDRRFITYNETSKNCRQQERLSLDELRLENSQNSNKRFQHREDKIVAIIPLYYTGIVYDFEVEEFHNYISNGILSSNSAARSYQIVLNHLGFGPEDIKSDPEKLLLGVTATPRRSDNLGLETTFDEIVYSKDLRDGITEGWLVDIVADRIKTNTSLDGISIQKGDYKEGELNAKVDNDERNIAIVQGYIDHALNKKTIVFCAGVEHTRHITDLFCREGVKAEMIIGSTDPYSRIAILERFKNGATKVLVGCMVFTEGFDAPDVECLIMARPTKSQTVYIQQLGRGLRTNCHLPVNSTPEERRSIIAQSKKPLLHLLDIVDNTTKHSPIMLPVLFGLNTKIKLNKIPVIEAVTRIENAKREAPNLDTSKITDITKIEKMKTEALRVNIWDSIALAKEVLQNSRFSWQKWEDGTYRMTLDKHETFILKENTLGKWEGAVESTAEWNGSDYIKHEPKLTVLGAEQNIESVFTRADRYIETNYPELTKIIVQNAHWHKDDPTPKQIACLVRYHYPIFQEGGKAFINDSGKKIPLTKGLAGKLITKKITQFQQHARA